MTERIIKIFEQTLPLSKPFRIARGVKRAANLIRVTIEQDGKAGHGECCPYQRYGESAPGVITTLEGVKGDIEAGLSRADLQTKLGAGAGRNALDCALWDLEAKLTGKPVSELTGLTPPETFTTLRTVVISTPEAMAAEAAGYARGVPLKVKLDQNLVAERLSAVRTGAPASPIVVDANEAWTADFLKSTMPRLKALGVVLLEQPLAAGADSPLGDIDHLVPVCADEACHTAADLPRLKGLYDVINIKLDKTGGLTEALALYQAASIAGFGIMLGCMVSSPLSIAPLVLLCPGADFIDLDGPLLLAAGGEDGMKEIKPGPLVNFSLDWGKPGR